MSLLGLRDSAVVRAREAFEQAMTSEATVMRLSQTPDTSGGFSDTYTVAGTYPCTFAHYQVRPYEREAQPRIQTVTEWSFNFPVGTDIRNTDRIVVGTRTFEVVDAGATPLELVRKAICLEIT